MGFCRIRGVCVVVCAYALKGQDPGAVATPIKITRG